MEKPSDLDVAKLFSLCLDKMKERGLGLVQTTDFEEAEDRALAIGKQSFTPMLSSAHNDFSRDDAFWLFLQRRGKDIGCVAARRGGTVFIQKPSLNTGAGRKNAITACPRRKPHTHMRRPPSTKSGAALFTWASSLLPRPPGGRAISSLCSRIFCTATPI